MIGYNSAALMQSGLKICDSTLRAGDEAAGAVFSNIERCRIAKLLDDAGVPQIEVGTPMSGTDEKVAVRNIVRMGLEASIMANSRAERSDIDACIDCGVDAITIGLPTSDIQIASILNKDSNWILDKISDVTEYAVSHGLETCVVAKDASRADLGFLIEYAKEARDAGASRLAYNDSIGVEDPTTCFERVQIINKIAGMPVEVIARNDFGMATANTIAAAKAGASYARVTMLGVGQRAGYAPLEEVVMASKHVLGIDTGIDTTKLRHIAETVAAVSGYAIASNKPILGSGCFSQEVVIINDPKASEPYDPEEVGTSRSLVIGKHSVRNTVVSAMQEFDVDLTVEEADRLLDLVRKASVQMHRSITMGELYQLHQDMKMGLDLFDDSPVVRSESPAAPVEEEPVVYEEVPAESYEEVPVPNQEQPQA